MADDPLIGRVPKRPVRDVRTAALLASLVWLAGCGTSSSPAEPSTVNPPAPPAATAPVIVRQPQGLSIDESQSTTLSVAAEGGAPLAFQWYAGPRGLTEYPLAGATSPTLQTGTLWVTASFWVRVSNPLGSVDSNAATVTVVPATGSPPGPSPTPSPGPSPAELFEVEVLGIVNAHRAAGAVCGTTTFGPAPALVLDLRLRDAARLHSIDMATQNYFSHTSLDGRTFSQRISATSFNGAKPWAENIAAGYASPAAMMSGLMASPGHCSNIMNPAYRAIGIGYAFGPGSTYGHYWTQDFAASQQ
jgi:uncharacterized protein YkwD